MNMQIRLEFTGVTLTQAEFLKHHFDAEMYTKHSDARIYPNLNLDEVQAKIAQLEQKYDFKLSYISHDLNTYGVEVYEKGVKQEIAALDIGDMYKIKEDFGMGSFFENIADTDEKFMPALNAALEEIFEFVGLPCELIELKGNELRYSVEDAEHELHITYSPLSKSILVQFGVEQAVSVGEEGDTELLYQTIEDLFENQLCESMFGELV